MSTPQTLKDAYRHLAPAKAAALAYDPHDVLPRVCGLHPLSLLSRPPGGGNLSWVTGPA